MHGGEAAVRREAAHQASRLIGVGAFGQVVEALQCRRQGTVSHGSGVREATTHQHIARRPDADAALGGQRILRRQRRAFCQPFDIQPVIGDRLCRIDQIARLRGRIAPTGKRARIQIGDGLGCGMGAHVADLLARQFDQVAPQAGGELHVDLLADDAPGQGVEASGQERHAQAPTWPDKFGMAGFKLGDVVGQRQDFQRRSVQRRHGGAAQFAVGMHLHPGLAVFDTDLQHRRAVPGMQRLPDAVAFTALAETLRIAGVITQDLPGTVSRRQVQQEHLRPIEGAVSARCHAHLAEELAVKHRL